MRMLRNPMALLCEGGASTIALMIEGSESTSPTPVIPSSVSMRISSASWLPSARVASTVGWRKIMA